MPEAVLCSWNIILKVIKLNSQKKFYQLLEHVYPEKYSCIERSKRKPNPCRENKGMFV